MAKEYRLPSGRITTSFNAYAREWQKIAKPIEAATGWRLGGFDPAFTFHPPNDNGNSVQMRSDFANKLANALRKADGTAESLVKRGISVTLLSKEDTERWNQARATRRLQPTEVQRKQRR